MGSLNRKLKRQKEKKDKKLFKKASKVIENKISMMPTSCSVCGLSFDKNDTSLIDSWTISVSKNIFNLKCPECS